MCRGQCELGSDFPLSPSSTVIVSLKGAATISRLVSPLMSAIRGAAANGDVPTSVCHSIFRL